ncbi:MAG: hypothetical protein JO307_19915 [Bryobacterales bacterium]|nr:hypothetical protein [Bryobacterales bacterium]MBV9399453.1 hypothetical protein [Bryobacterales bacterium]
MKERYLLDEISRRVREAAGFADALESIRLLLEEEAGRAILLVRFAKTAGSHLREKPIADLLESREFPVRSVYTSRFDAGGDRKAVLIGCFGSWGASGDMLERATAHAAAQLGAFLARTNREVFLDNEAA